MKQNLRVKVIYYIFFVIVGISLFFTELSLINVSQVNAQTYPTLRIRVRYSDGTAAEGLKIELYREDMGLPDIYEGDCVVSRGGFCEFTLTADWSYIIKFPGDQQPDPITAAAAGHSGIDGIGIILREDYSMGFVLSKLVEAEGEANWMLLDLAPEADMPLPRIPKGAIVEAQKILDEGRPREPVQAYPTVTQIPTVERIQVAVPAIASVAVPNGEPQEISDIELIEVNDIEVADQNEKIEGEVEEAELAPEQRNREWLPPLFIAVLAVLLFVGWVVLTLRKHSHIRAANKAKKEE